MVGLDATGVATKTNAPNFDAGSGGHLGGGSARPPHLPMTDTVVQLVLKPVEQFEENNLELTKVEFSKYYIIVEGAKLDDTSRQRIYSPSGRIVCEVKPLSAVELNQRLTAQDLSGWKKLNSIELRSGIVAALQGVQFADHQANHVLQKCGAFKHSDGDIQVGNYTGNNALGCQKISSLLYTWPLVGGDSGGRYFVFRHAGGLAVVDTFDEEGRPRLPSAWKLENCKDGVDPKTVAKYPFLQAYNPSINGVPLPNGTHLASYLNGVLTLLQSNDLQRIHSDACNGYAIDPADSNALLYINSAVREIKLVDLANSTPRGSSVKSWPLPFDGDVTDFKMDPAGNFLLCTVTGDPNTASSVDRLVVLDKESMQVCAELPGVLGPITIDPVGSIYFIDSAKRLRLVNTNLGSIPTGGFEALAEQKKQEALKRIELAERLVLPELPDGLGRVKDSSSVEVLDYVLAKTIFDRFAPQVAELTTLAALDRFENQLALLKEGDEFKRDPKAFDLIDREVSSRRNVLQVLELRTAIEGLTRGLQEEQITIANLRDFDARIATLKQLRTEVSLATSDDRQLVDRQIREIIALRATAYSVCRGDAQGQLCHLQASITETIDSCSSVDEVYAVLSSKDYEHYTDLVALLDSAEERRSFRHAIDEVVTKQIEQLGRALEETSARDLERRREASQAAAKLLEKVVQAAATLTTPSQVRTFQTGALVAVFTKAALALDPVDRQAAEASLITTLDKARQRVQTAAQVNTGVGEIHSSGGLITVGSEKFIAAGEYSPIIKSGVRRSKLDPSQSRFVFRDSFGRKFESGPTSIDLSSSTTDSVRAKAFEEAVAHFRSLGRRVPDLRPNWVFTKYTVECLEKIIKELNIQRESRQGILILEGEAGTGKNVLIDILAHLGRYERFLFACNYQTQKEDFTYEYAFTPKRGTFRVSAKLIEKLGTPYVMNAFDEINTLPPGVFKMLNALLDERRTLYLADGREIPMDPTSVLVGFMNPRHYVGTQAISKEVVSRANFVTIGYPPLQRASSGGGMTYAPDEALMLAQSIPALGTLAQADFEGVWDEVINLKKEAKGISAEQRKLLTGLHTVTKVANSVRTQYSNYQRNLVTQQMDFVFCLRTSSSIARRLKPDSNVLELIKEVTLPKADDPETKKNLELLITTT